MTENKPTILIIEDEQDYAKLLREQIELHDCHAEIVTDGAAAVETVRTIQPNLIILDLILPGKDGYSILKEIKADPQLKKTKVLILTNLGRDTDSEKAKKMGAIDLVLKTNVSLKEFVARAIALAKQSQTE